MAVNDRDTNPPTPQSQVLTNVDLLQTTLGFLPSQNLSTAQLVCRQWVATIKDRRLLLDALRREFPRYIFNDSVALAKTFLLIAPEEDANKNPFFAPLVGHFCRFFSFNYQEHRSLFVDIDDYSKDLRFNDMLKSLPGSFRKIILDRVHNQRLNRNGCDSSKYISVGLGELLCSLSSAYFLYFYLTIPGASDDNKRAVDFLADCHPNSLTSLYIDYANNCDVFGRALLPNSQTHKHLSQITINCRDDILAHEKELALFLKSEHCLLDTLVFSQCHFADQHACIFEALSENRNHPLEELAIIDSLFLSDVNEIARYLWKQSSLQSLILAGTSFQDFSRLAVIFKALSENKNNLIKNLDLSGVKFQHVEVSRETIIAATEYLSGEQFHLQRLALPGYIPKEFIMHYLEAIIKNPKCPLSCLEISNCGENYQIDEEVIRMLAELKFVAQSQGRMIDVKFLPEASQVSSSLLSLDGYFTETERLEMWFSYLLNGSNGSKCTIL